MQSDTKERISNDGVRNFNTYIKALKPILLSHHPNCKAFKNHTFKIGRFKFCIGCFIGFPTAIIGIIVLPFIKILNILDSTQILIISLVFLSSSILSPLKLTKIKLIKMIQKCLIGLGASYLFWWIWTLPNFFLINLLYFLGIFALLLIFLNGYHAISFYSICRKCEYSREWNRCPGFRDHIKYLKERNLPNIFSSIKNKRK